MKQVLIAAPISDPFKNVLIEKSYELVFHQTVNVQALPSDMDAESTSIVDLQRVEGIITSNKLLLNKTELDKYPQLRWIARLGSGMEIIDTKYCDEKGIHYFSSPRGIANSVAEHVTGMLLSLLHKINSSQQEIKDGKWIRDANRGIELQGMTVGIIGYGHTGSRVAQKLSAFTEPVLVYDKYKSDFGDKHIIEVTLEQICAQADIVTFHVPLNAETKHYYNAGFISAMEKKHIIINSSRGAVADTGEILKGLQSGKIIGACLDVLEEEKNITEVLGIEHNIVHQLLQQNVIITPHIAGYSQQAISKMSEELLLKLDTCL